MMVWTSLVVVATVLLALNGGAHVIRHEDVDAAPAETPQEISFNKHWQEVLGDTEHTYKKQDLGPLDVVTSVLDQTRASKEKIYNAEFGIDAGNNTQHEDKVNEENAKDNRLIEKNGDEIVDKQENLLGGGEPVIDAVLVKEYGLQELTPAQRMDKEEDKLDEEALKEEREEEDKVKERQTEAYGLEGETPEVYMDKQGNELGEDTFKEMAEEDAIEKEEDAKEDILKEAYEENGGNSDGHIAKDIAKLYAVSPTKDDKPEGTSHGNNTESSGLVTGDEQRNNEKELNGTVVDLAYDDNNAGLYGEEFNGDRESRKEKQDETVVNDTKKTNKTTEGSVEGDVNADVKNNATQEQVVAIDENEDMNIEDQDIVDFIQLMFDHGIGNASLLKSMKETQKNNATSSKVDGGSMAEDELATKEETDAASEDKVVGTNENEPINQVGQEIVELTFFNGGENTLDQQTGKGEEKDKEAKSRVNAESLVDSEVGAEKSAGKTEEKATATSENEKADNDKQGVIEIIEVMYGDVENNTRNQQHGKEEEKPKTKKEKEKGKSAKTKAKVDEESLIDSDHKKAEENIKATNENENFDTFGRGIIEIVEVAFGDGGNKTSDQEKGNEKKEKGKSAKVDKESLTDGDLETKQSVEKTDEETKATSENDETETDGQGIIDIVQITFADVGNKTSDQEKGKEKQEKNKGKSSSTKESSIDGELDTKKEEKTEEGKDKTSSENDKKETDEIVASEFGDRGDKTEVKEDVNREVKIKNGDSKTDKKVNKKAKSKQSKSTITPDKATETSVKEDVGRNSTNTTGLTNHEEAATLKTSNETTVSQNETIANVEGAILSGNTDQDPEIEEKMNDTNKTELINPEGAATLKTNNETTASQEETNKNAKEALLADEIDRENYSEANAIRELREARYSAPLSKTTDSPASHVNIEHISRPGWSANLATSDGPVKQYSSKSLLVPLPISRQWPSSPFEMQESRNIPGYIVNEKVIQRSYVTKPSDLQDQNNVASNPDQQGAKTDEASGTPAASSPTNKLSQLRNEDKIDLDQNLEAQPSYLYPNSIPDVNVDQELNYLRPPFLSNPPQPNFPNIPMVPALVPLPLLYPLIPFPFLLPGPNPGLRPPYPPFLQHSQPNTCSPYDNDNSYPPLPQW